MKRLTTRAQGRKKTAEEEPLMVYAAPRTVWLFLDELDTSLDAGEIQVGEKLFVRKVSEEIMQALETAKVERGPELLVARGY